MRPRSGVLMVVVVLVLVLGVLAGCSFLAPGYDTRTATEQRTTTSWTSNDDLLIEESSTHNREVVAAENNRENGENQTVTIERGDNGVIKVGGATHVMYSFSEPKDVSVAKMNLDLLNFQIADAVTQRLFSTIDKAITLRADAATVSAGQPSRLELILDRLDRYLPATRPE